MFQPRFELSHYNFFPNMKYSNVIFLEEYKKIQFKWEIMIPVIII